MGRAAILEELGRRRDAALADQPQLCLLHGVAGAGKTAVLHAFLQAWPNAAAGAGTVLWAAGTRHEASTGYAVLSQLDRRFLRLLDTERPLLPATRAGVEVLELLDALQRRGPVLVAVDDAHWADAASLHALLFALRRLRRDRVLTVLAYRPEEAGDALAELEHHAADHGALVELPGLRPDEVGRLAQRHGCALSARGAARLAAHTAGNPLSVIELARTLTAAEIERAPLLPAPRSIDAAVRHRLATLSEPARRLATAAAVLGERCTLAAASSLGEVADAVSAAAEAARLSLLGTEGNGAATTVHFVHPLFESAVYNALGVDERTALHRRAASLAAPENEQLRHLRAAATGPDPALAARIAERAGSEMARAAPAAAAEWYLAAAELAGSDGDRERWRWLAVHALIQGGEIRRAAWAAAETAPAGPATAFRRYVEGTLSLLRGDGAAAGLALEQGWALAAGGPTMADPALAATIAAQLGLVALVLDDVEGVRRWAHRSVRAAEAGGVTEHLGQVLVAYGAWWDGRADEALAGCALLDELDAEAQLTTAIDARNGRLLLRLWTDDEAGVRADAAIMERSLRRYGPSVYGAISLANLAELEYRLGNWDAGLAGSEAAVSLGADLGHSWHAVCYPVAAAHVCAARGQWDHADRYVAAVRAATHRNADPTSWVYLDSVEAAAAFARGELDRLLEVVRPLEHATGAIPGVCPHRMLRIDALIGLGRLGAADRELRRVELAAGARQHRSTMAITARLRGQLASLHGRHDEAVSHLRRAIAGCDELGLRFEAARARAAHGDALGRAGRLEPAHRELQAALRTFEALGAQPYAEPVVARLAELGLAAPERSPRLLGELTPQEVAVARLVADGRTNKEVAAELFLSVKTVEYHLGHVYAKLAIRRRTELARLVHGAA